MRRRHAVALTLAFLAVFVAGCQSTSLPLPFSSPPKSLWSRAELDFLDQTVTIGSIEVSETYPKDCTGKGGMTCLRAESGYRLLILTFHGQFSFDALDKTLKHCTQGDIVVINDQQERTGCISSVRFILPQDSDTLKAESIAVAFSVSERAKGLRLQVLRNELVDLGY